MFCDARIDFVFIFDFVPIDQLDVVGESDDFVE